MHKDYPPITRPLRWALLHLLTWRHRGWWRFALQFDPEPKDAIQGFVFGTDEEKCDVQLLENPDLDNKYGISRQHFRIDFNWKSGFLRLNNISPTNGIGITAPSVNNGYQLLSITTCICYTRPSKPRFILTHLYSKSFYFEDDISSVFEYKDSIVRVVIIALFFSLYKIRVNIIID